MIAISSSNSETAATPAKTLAGGAARRFVALMGVLALALVACTPESETTGSINSCAKDLFANYSPKVLDQCVAACRKCDHGTITTCTTSCTLKGAH
ncbi:MAG TPA: hypothetical protein VFL62_15680 [Bradyrhizobium sp.]|uniref:hypothetical protein n=1 Tax=Bradyrhizobium sp. TaxID=376 RepID=UPI002D7E14CF|nr:hypothetical protein [Bradyrhizobium sp.]HET7887664.1 hypothetical protein [Bradyrhizobium sp.]